MSRKKVRGPSSGHSTSSAARPRIAVAAEKTKPSRVRAGKGRDTLERRPGPTDTLERPLRSDSLERRPGPVPTLERGLAFDAVDGPSNGARRRSRSRMLDDMLDSPEELLVEQERVRAIGELAFGIAHDVNNILAALRLRLGIVIKDPACARTQASNLEAMNRILHEGTALVGKLQDLRPAREPRMEPVDLVECIRSAVEIAQSGLSLRAAETGVLIRIRCDLERLPRVRGYDEDLRHVFVNLLINARDAMPKGGTILITARHQGSRVIVRVQDEGDGIPSGFLTRIFDPFFTTKGANGTGMGLAMARTVMKRLGSTIVARNRPTGGACFELRFQPYPADEEDPANHLEEETFVPPGARVQRGSVAR